MSDLRETLSEYVQDQTPTAPPSFDGIVLRARHRAHRRTATFAAVTAVPVAMVAIMVGTQLASAPAPDRVIAPSQRTGEAPQGGLSPQTPDSGQSTEPARPTERALAPVPHPGPTYFISLANCAENYNLTALNRSAFAFDGTVSGVSARPKSQNGSDMLDAYPFMVTFTVREWFRGGDQTSVTVDMMAMPVPEAPGSQGEGTDFRLGARLLVSGNSRTGGLPLQDPIASVCGLTRLYDEADANTWRQTLGKK